MGTESVQSSGGAWSYQIAGVKVTVDMNSRSVALSTADGSKVAVSMSGGPQSAVFNLPGTSTK